MLNWLFGDKAPQEVIMRDASATETMIWQHPSTEFNTNSRVNLLPNEIAVFFDMYNGETKIIERSQDLKTGNIPILERFSTAMSGGISKYQCRVYFIRTSQSENISWGTRDYLGPYEDGLRKGLFFKFKMSGFYNVRIADPLKLMQLIDADKVVVFRDFMKSRVLDNLLAYIVEKINCIMTTISLDFIGYKYLILKTSSALAEDIQRDVLDDYGVKLTRFQINNIVLPTDKEDPYNKALAMLSEEGAMASAVDVQGMQKYLLTHGVRIAELAASGNGTAGAMAGIGIGTGVGAGIGGSLGGMIQNTLESLGVGLPSAAVGNVNGFSGIGQTQQTMGMPMQPGMPPVYPSPSDHFNSPQQQPEEKSSGFSFESSARLEKLKFLYDSKIITKEQYDTAVQDVLRSI